MVAASHWRQPSWAGHAQLHTPTTTAQNHNQHGRAMPCSMLSLYIPLSLSHPPYRTLSNYICISCSLPLPVYPSLYLSAYPSQPPLSHPLLAPPQSASSNKIYMGTRATHVSNSLRIIRCALCADSKFMCPCVKCHEFPSAFDCVKCHEFPRLVLLDECCCLMLLVFVARMCRASPWRALLICVVL